MRIDVNIPVTSGTNSYTVTSTPTLLAMVTNQLFYVKFNNANTGPSTLQIDSNVAVSIVKNGSTPLSAGDISAGQILALSYDGTNLQMIGGGGSSYNYGLGYVMSTFNYLN